MGRPRIELTPDQLELIEKLAGLGLTQAEVANVLPMSERTLARRLSDGDPDVVAAYARGRDEDKAALSRQHRKLAMGEIDGVSVSDQRKALEWRLERQHKIASQSQTDITSGGKPIAAIERRIVDPRDP